MKSLKLNFLYNVLLNVSKVVFPLVTAPYVARVLNPDGIGMANFSASLAGYFFMFAALGIPTHAMREVAKAKGDRERMSKLVSEIFSLSLLLNLTVGLIYYSSLFVVGQFRENILLFAACGIGFLFTPFDNSWYFAGEERFGFTTMRHLIVKVIAIVCLFLFVKTKQDVVIYAMINILSLSFGQLWGFIEMLRCGVTVRFTFKGLLQHLKPSLVLFASTLAVSIYTMLDTIMLGFMTDYSEVGYYNCASNVSKIILAVVTSFSAVAVPRISYYLENGLKDEVNSLINKSLSVIFFIAIPAAFGLCAVAPVFVPLFYGPGFDGTIMPLRIMSFVILAIGLNNITAWQTLIGLSKDKMYVLVVICGAVLNFVLNLILIPHAGSVGASAASVSAEVLILLVSLVVVYRQTFVRLRGISDGVKALAASVLFFPLIHLLSRFLDGWVLVGVFVSSGFCLYILLQWIFKNSAFGMVVDTAVGLLDKFKAGMSR